MYKVIMLALLSIALAPAGRASSFPDPEPPVSRGGPTPKLDKSGYHLFYPTPRDLMRDLFADRPDATESPYTVDAGHFQVETTFAGYSRDDDNGVDTETWIFGAFNFKAGLLNHVDIQFVFDSYTKEKETEGGVSETADGFSDLQVRLKINLWGNDAGRTALAFFPFVTIPTGTNLSSDKVEGGIILPFAMELTERLGLGLQAEVDFVYDEESSNHEAEFLHTAVLGVEITDRLGCYIEYIGAVGVDAGYRPSASGGVTFAINADTVLDAGAVVGLHDKSEDFSAFTGMTLRF